VPRFRARIRAVDLGLAAVRTGLGLLFLIAGAAKLAEPSRLRAPVYRKTRLKGGSPVRMLCNSSATAAAARIACS
jgi:hypothetical protein